MGKRSFGIRCRGRSVGRTGMRIKGWTLRAQPGPFSSTKSSGVVSHGRRPVISARAYWVADVDGLMQPRVGGHERADDDGERVELQRRQHEALRRPRDALHHEVANLYRGDELGKAVLLGFVVDLF
ncbi:hypothetical protein PpBr36_02116 [Pyricularia pennisetigena]|uniref:hypothetical protein n=1 Tax=Pyricularia pennisetigena TaxID=1578925 RepID=UPI0011507D38|nr:hypothetical protein PpBr36_02116 [Pyricularia pennisetigena]TLS29488.1 hypothetical protein PpBr36_02116 [Pyricularia pennisetigena]